ncbi:hypothetical protein B0J12DRAFT_774465 [Macrophomina phaseolina]|uniref:RING-type domain-containing protein n=1 Tax=Macrophomina phaseolina TaxID=35725 RepID=A0ABQ8GL60_9PEZI|nr:hypothetical protein B0J12DRAFT_774465 [Macrophomina phaseolina]
MQAASHPQYSQETNMSPKKDIGVKPPNKAPFDELSPNTPTDSDKPHSGESDSSLDWLPSNRHSPNRGAELAESCERVGQAQHACATAWRTVANRLRAVAAVEAECRRLLQEQVELEVQKAEMDDDDDDGRGARSLSRDARRRNQAARCVNLANLGVVLGKLAEASLRPGLSFGGEEPLVGDLERYVSFLLRFQRGLRRELCREGMFRWLVNAYECSSEGCPPSFAEMGDAAAAYATRRICIICRDNVPFSATPRPVEHNTPVVLSHCCRKVFHRTCLEASRECGHRSHCPYCHRGEGYASETSEA